MTNLQCVLIVLNNNNNLIQSNWPIYVNYNEYKETFKHILINIAKNKKENMQILKIKY